MPTPQERLAGDVRNALKAHEKERVATLRMLLADVKNEAIRLGGEVAEDEFLGLVNRAVKRRREAAEQFRTGNRSELAAKEEREISYLEVYLPRQATEEEIRAAVKECVASQGLTGPQALGQVMKAIMPQFRGSADGATVNRIAREVLAGSE